MSGERYQVQKWFSCKSEEDYFKAKDSLTLEETKLIEELHEEYEDYLEVRRKGVYGVG